MGWVVSALLALSSPQADVSDLLPSRQISVPCVHVDSLEPVNFDLVDYRAEEKERPQLTTENEPHTIFGIKKHVGIAAGYDNQTTHGSVGWYLTVAEWGRWNFGVPSPAIGIGRYAIYKANRKQVVATTDYSIVISLVSVHYRAGYLKSLGMNWYVNVEQIFDVRANMPGSQVGISLSRK
jgi:hypothetical protein